MTAPDLVEVVAAELRKHDARWSLDGNRSRLECDCGAEVIAGDATAHQARAVLAALTEAGTVEWGLQTKTFIDGDYDRTVTTINYRPLTREDAQDHANGMNQRHPIARVVSRLTLPWTAVGE